MNTAPVQYWVVRDAKDYFVDAFDIGEKHLADTLSHDYGVEYGSGFTVSLEYIQTVCD